MTINDARRFSVADLPPFLSSAQVAELLGLHPATLRQWRHQRRGLAYTKLGVNGVVRYSRETVLAFLEAGTMLASKSNDTVAGSAASPR